MAKFVPHEVEINRTGISFERLDGEVVIISFETGKYFNSNGTAADLLYLIEHGVSQEKWEQILDLSFVNFRSDSEEIAGFLSHAIEERILIAGMATANSNIDLPSDYERGEWSVPRLSVFDDLADLLLVDPIHDTSTEGWPKTKDA
jgi:hypothetical protein